MKKLKALSAVCALAFALGVTGVTAPSPALAADASNNPDPYQDAVTTSLEDGDYTIEVAMTGGSGRASIDSPAQMTVKHGKAVATITWSSQFYDYMIVNGQKYVQVNDIDDGGNSQFVVPILAFDEPATYTADTVAMSTPHEIEYQLTFDSSTATPVQATVPWTGIIVGVVIAAVVVIVIVAVVLANRKRKREEAALQQQGQA